jgi:hypothetical protein
MRTILCVALSAAVMAGGPSDQYPSAGFRTGEGVMVRIADGDYIGKYWNMDTSAGPPRFAGTVRLGHNPDNRFTFVLDRRPTGTLIYFGSNVRIRYVGSGSPWLLAASGNPDMVAMRDQGSAWEGLFRIEDTAGGPGGRARRGGDRRVDFLTPFRLRVSECSCWLGWDSTGTRLGPVFQADRIATFMVDLPWPDFQVPAKPSTPPASPSPSRPSTPAPQRIAIPPTFRVQTTGSAIVVYATNSGTVPYFCSLSYTYAHDSGGETKTGTDSSTFLIPGQTRDQVTYRLSTTWVNLRATSSIAPQCNPR